jgi:hypothetical protein
VGGGISNDLSGGNFERSLTARNVPLKLILSTTEKERPLWRDSGAPRARVSNGLAENGTDLLHDTGEIAPNAYQADWDAHS